MGSSFSNIKNFIRFKVIAIFQSSCCNESSVSEEMVGVTEMVGKNKKDETGMVDENKKDATLEMTYHFDHSNSTIIEEKSHSSNCDGKSFFSRDPKFFAPR